MIFRRLITCVFLLGTMLVFAPSTFAQQSDIEKELMADPEFSKLMQKNNELTQQSEDVSQQIQRCRERLEQATDGAEKEAIRSEYIALEQLLHNLSIERGEVTRTLNDMIQDYILNGMISAQDSVVIGEVIEEGMSQGIDSVQYANLVDNECFKSELSADDYADLLRAQAEELEMVKLSEEYIKTYERLEQVAAAYAVADRLSVAEPLFEEYEQLVKRLEDIDENMNSMWNHILDTKYYSMSYILEKLYRYDILERSSSNYQIMQQRCAANDGKFSSDALMRYAMGRPTLLNYEWEFARDMRLKSAQDSLRRMIDGYRAPSFSLQPISVERREFKDFAKVKIGRTNFYDESNPLPELRVYPSGTIYRILLGKFRSKQAMTLFKGVQPMSIERDDEGLYCYYAGGYATEEEARDDMQFLKGKGFKGPEICRWIDGEMTNITALESSSSKSEQKSSSYDQPKVQYVVVIRTDELDGKMRSIINSEASGKSVSRSGRNYMVSFFRSRGEADALLTALTESFPTLEMSVIEASME